MGSEGVPDGVEDQGYLRTPEWGSGREVISGNILQIFRSERWYRILIGVAGGLGMGHS